mmetsp:Transcript_4026/g.5393  ORF Transcript_4026/g.5393 Transcript_4026/m.5393 type:complete len:107 (-) Transcript_4026:226-546(-)
MNLKRSKLKTYLAIMLWRDGSTTVSFRFSINSYVKKRFARELSSQIWSRQKVHAACKLELESVEYLTTSKGQGRLSIQTTAAVVILTGKKQNDLKNIPQQLCSVSS